MPPEAGSPRTYGVLSSCVVTDDVLTLAGTFGAAMGAKYEDSGTNPNPKIAEVYAPSSLPGTSDHPMLTIVDGFRIQDLGTRATLQHGGLMLYVWEALVNVFGSISCGIVDGPTGVGDTPNGQAALVNFLALRSEDPYRGDLAKISFGITRKEKVELRLYDVAGRLVRTLANREFTAGAKSFLFPWHRLSFVEVMTTDGEKEDVIEFFREDR